MKTQIKVVIGANFGDEGKGLMTDYFCHKFTSQNMTCLNVLTNGGAQRGHTVDTENGDHHTFKHFGAGTYSNADSYFSEYYILNPMQFHKEYDELFGHLNNTYVNWSCRWSTPWDIIVNQIIETARDDNRHGSCGMGIWETVDRYLHTISLPIYTFNSMNKEDKIKWLKDIRDNYFENRVNNYKIFIDDEWESIWFSDNLIYNFIQDVEYLCKKCIPCDNKILRNYQSVVMENGQGLMLSMQNVFGDNTTPSQANSLHPCQIINSVFKPDEVDVEFCYVSRTYITRHGPGAFYTECKKESINSNMNDSVNILNEFQGKLRYGYLDIDGLIHRIGADSSFYNRILSNYQNNVSIAFTHTNEYKLTDDKDFRDKGICKTYESNGMYRNSVIVNE